MAVAMGAVAMGDRVPPQRAADRSRSLRGRYRSLRARRRVSSARDRGGYGAVEAQIDEYRTRKTRWGRERGAKSSLPVPRPKQSARASGREYRHQDVRRAWRAPRARARGPKGG